MSRLKKLSYNADLDQSNYVIPGEPLYPQDYFKQRDPKRLKQLKELHEKGQYLNFEEVTMPTMTAGMAIDKVNKISGDTVTVYHGTSAALIDAILSNGLTENIDNSYQSNGASYGVGIWVTLNYNGAKQYAIDSANGFTKDHQDDDNPEVTQYFDYGAILEMEVAKDSLNDEGSASNNNLKSNEVITPDKIKQIYIFDIKSGQTWNYF